MDDTIPASSTAAAHSRPAWNKGKITGPKPPLRPVHVWAIRVKLQLAKRMRDLAMFNLVIDRKLCATRDDEHRGAQLKHVDLSFPAQVADLGIPAAGIPGKGGHLLQMVRQLGEQPLLLVPSSADKSLGPTIGSVSGTAALLLRLN